MDRTARLGRRRAIAFALLTRQGEKALVRIKALTARHEAWLIEFAGSKRYSALMDLLKDFG